MLTTSFTVLSGKGNAETRESSKFDRFMEDAIKTLYEMPDDDMKPNEMFRWFADQLDQAAKEADLKKKEREIQELRERIEDARYSDLMNGRISPHDQPREIDARDSLSRQSPGVLEA